MGVLDAERVILLYSVGLNSLFEDQGGDYKWIPRSHIYV
jgi:hypothetical protein